MSYYLLNISLSHAYLVLASESISKYPAKLEAGLKRVPERDKIPLNFLSNLSKLPFSQNSSTMRTWSYKYGIENLDKFYFDSYISKYIVIPSSNLVHAPISWTILGWFPRQESILISLNIDLIWFDSLPGLRVLTATFSNVRDPSGFTVFNEHWNTMPNIPSPKIGTFVSSTKQNIFA